MKTTTLNTADRAIVQTLCTTMMDMNERNDNNASQWGDMTKATYGHLHNAICSFVLNQTGVDISNPPTRHGWNLCGNADFAEDIQVVINLCVGHAVEEALKAAPEITDGDYTLIHDETGSPVKVGQTLLDFRGDATTITGGQAGSGGSTGRVFTLDDGSFYPSVVGCTWTLTADL